MVDPGEDLARQNGGLCGSSNHWLQLKTESQGGGTRVKKEFPPQHDVGFVIQYNQMFFFFLNSFFFLSRKKLEVILLQWREALERGIAMH